MTTQQEQVAPETAPEAQEDALTDPKKTRYIVDFTDSFSLFTDIIARCRGNKQMLVELKNMLAGLDTA